MEQGEEIILPDPYYACYPNFIRYLGGQPVLYPFGRKTDSNIAQKKLRNRLVGTRGVIVNSPANPPVRFSGQELAAMAEIGPTIIADEIYHGLVYEGEEHSILEFTDQAFVINGFSKLYAMTGWRLGWVIAPLNIPAPYRGCSRIYLYVHPHLRKLRLSQPLPSATGILKIWYRLMTKDGDIFLGDLTKWGSPPGLHHRAFMLWPM